jgi:hypothetical protein
VPYARFLGIVLAGGVRSAAAFRDDLVGNAAARLRRRRRGAFLELTALVG